MGVGAEVGAVAGTLCVCGLVRVSIGVAVLWLFYGCIPYGPLFPDLDIVLCSGQK